MTQNVVDTNSEFITAIDVGTTKVCTVVARKSKNGFPELVSYSSVPNSGVKRGNIVDANATSDAISRTIEQIRSNVGIEIKSAYVSITGAHISYENRVDSFSDIGRQGVVTLDEVFQVPQLVANRLDLPGRTIIHAFPLHYKVDGHDGIKNPVGMHVKGLEVTTHLITSDSFVVDKLRDVLSLASISLKSMVIDSYASGEAVLTQMEKDAGCAVVDIGGGTTDIVLYKNGSVVYTTTIPIGGFQFTNDICLTYNLSFTDAEQLKLQYGDTNLGTIDLTETIAISPIGSSAQIELRRRDLCQLMRERSMELIRLIDLKLQQGGLKENPNSMVYITGGSSRLPGMYEMAEQFIPNCLVKRGIPDFLMGITNELRDPCFATAVGIVLHGFRHEAAAERLVGMNEITEGTGFLGRIKRLLKLT